MNPIRYFPSLIFFIAAVYFGVVDHTRGPTAQSKKPQSSPGPAHVRSLTSSSFDNIALDTTKDAFVMFYAPWCGHCQHFGPAYETVARTFAADSASVVIAKIDLEADEGGMAIAECYAIRGYPTLMWFPKDNKEGVPYEGSRDAKEIVQFVNAKSGLRRLLGGALEPLAGTSDALNAIAKDFLKADAEGKEACITAIGEADAEAPVKAMYTKVMRKIVEKGAEYVPKETARVAALLESTSSMSLEKVDEFVKKRNVLAVFAA